MGVVYLIAPEPLIALFTSDRAIIEEGIPAMRMVGLARPIWALPMVLSGTLRGAGDTRFPLVMSFVCGWLIRVPFGYLLGITVGLGLWGIYAGMVADAVVGGLMTLWRYRRGAWRDVRVELD